MATANHRACLEAADWFLDAYPPDLLWQALTTQGRPVESLFAGGFQRSAKGLSHRAVRKRLVQAVASDSALRTHLVGSPGSPSRPWVRALEALEPRWVQEHWRELVRGGGRGLLFALSSASDPVLAMRGNRLLRRPGVWGREYADADSWPDALRALSRRSDPVQAASNEFDAAAARKLEQRERELAEVRESLANAKLRLRRSAQEHEDDKREWDQQRRDFHRQMREHAQCLAACREDAENDVAARVGAFRQRFAGFLPSVVAPAADSAPGLLVARARDVLRRQAELDRQYGARTALRQRIGELEALCEDVTTAIDESLMLLPEVTQLHAQLLRELETSRGILGDHVEEADTPDLGRQLEARIKDVQRRPDSAGELGRIRDLLENPLISDLLGSDGTEALRGLVAERQELVEHIVPGPESSSADPVIPEIWNVRASMNSGEAERICLLIDGYNVTKRVSVLAQFEQERGLAAVRELLVGKCNDHLHGFSEVSIVFDGIGTAGGGEMQGKVKVVFSGRTAASQNADAYIVRRTAVLHEKGMATWVVTDDYGLRDQLRNVCSGFVSPAHLYSALTSE